MRAAAVRFVIAFLMSFLLAPYSGTLPASGAPSAHAHATTPGTGADRPGDALTAHGEYGTCGTPDRGGEPNGLLRHRDRHRSATVPAPETPSRSVVASATGGLLAPAAVAAMGNGPHISRCPTAHSPSALQVFRC